MKKVYKEINIDKIYANANQPRTIFDEEKIEELAHSIEENGLLQPITVRKVAGNFEIIAGERRYRACKKLGLKDIPCIIQQMNDQDVDVVAIIENIQRENLSVIEEAKAYQTLLLTYGYTQSELARRVGKKQATVANKLRLLKLSDPIKESLDKKEITERHARALLSVEKEQQEKVLQTILEKQWNVKQTEEFIAKPKVEPKPKAKRKIVAKNIKIAVNTIHQSVKMIEKTGTNCIYEESESDGEFVMIIRIKK